MTEKKRSFLNNSLAVSVKYNFNGSVFWRPVAYFEDGNSLVWSNTRENEGEEGRGVSTYSTVWEKMSDHVSLIIDPGFG